MENKVWTLEHLFNLILSSAKDRKVTEEEFEHFFKYTFYCYSDILKNRDMWDWCKRISEGTDEDAFKAWLKVPKRCKDEIILAALKHDPNTHFIFDGKIILM